MARADGEVRIDVNVDDTKARGSAKNLKGIFGTMGRGIVVALAAVGTAMVGIGVAAVRAGDVANASLGAIRAQTGMTEEDTRQLDRAIRDLALSQGRFSAQQMREALVDISVHGQTAAEQTLILESAMRLADATGSDLGGMAYALGATLLKFGQDASYAEMWANKFATAQRFTAVETQSLLYAMGVAAPTMNSLGLAAQQGGSGYARLAATMAVAQQEMMSHTGAARGFEEIMGTLNSTILGGSERFAELGVAVRNYDGTARDHFDVLDDLVGAFGGLDAQQQYALENYLNLGVYGAALLDIMRRQGGAISDLSVEMGNFNNIAEMGQERTGGFAEAFGTARAMGQEFLYMINEVIGARIYEWVTNAASGMKVFMAELRESGVIERFAEGIFSVVESLFRVAEALAPVVMEWLPKLAEALAIGAEWLGENSELAMGLGIAVVGLWAAFKGYAIIKSVIGMLGGLKTGIVALKGKKAIGGMAPAMSKAVGAKGGGKGMLGGATKLLKAIGPKGWAVLAVGAGAIAAIRHINNQRDAIAEDFDAMYEVTGSRTAAMAYAAAQNMGLMSDRSQDKMSELMAEHGTLFTYLYNTGKSKSEAMAAVVATHYGAMKDDARSELAAIEADSQAVWDRVYAETGSSAKATAAVVEAGYEQMRMEAVNRLRQLEKDSQYYGEALPAGIQTGLDRGSPSVFTAIGDFARGIADRFRNFFGINSPSRLMATFGDAMGEGLSQGIGRSEGLSIASAQQLGRRIAQEFDQMNQNLQRIWGNLVSHTQERFGNLVGTTREYFGQMQTAIRERASEMVQTARTNWEQLSSNTRERFGEVVSNTRDRWNEAASAVRERAVEIASTVGSRLGEVRQNVQERWSQIRNMTADDWRGMATTVATQASEIARSAATTFGNMARDAVNWGRQTVDGLASGIRNAASGAVNAIVNVGSSIVGGFRRALGINSPSREMMKMGTSIVAGLDRGMDSANGNVARVSQNMSATVVRALNSLPNQVRGIGQNTGNGLANSLSGLPNSLNGIGHNAMRGLDNGLRSGSGAVMNTARNLANQVRNTMQSALRINSPSRVMADEVGQWIPKGIAEGIEKYSGVVEHSLDLAVPKINLDSFLQPVSVGGAGTTNHYHQGVDSDGLRQMVEGLLGNQPEIHNHFYVDGAEVSSTLEPHITQIQHRKQQRSRNGLGRG